MITAAAAVMVAVFGAFAISGDRVLELFGLVDGERRVPRRVRDPDAAAARRAQLLGRAHLGLPRGLERRLPRLAIEPPVAVLEPESAERVDEPALTR